MSSFKPFLRITVLSIILASLLIYLGVRYHWGDHLQLKPNSSLELPIPVKQEKSIVEATIEQNISSFNPEIIQSKSTDTLLSSMNKEQVAEQCINLLSKEVKDSLTLELATVNCVVSNYQETFQNTRNVNDEVNKVIEKKKNRLRKQCFKQYKTNTQYSNLEKQLLVGICVSDNLNNTQ